MISTEYKISITITIPIKNRSGKIADLFSLFRSDPDFYKKNRSAILKSDRDLPDPGFYFPLWRIHPETPDAPGPRTHRYHCPEIQQCTREKNMRSAPPQNSPSFDLTLLYHIRPILSPLEIVHYCTASPTEIAPIGGNQGNTTVSGKPCTKIGGFCT
jgi:hypothetical protein